MNQREIARLRDQLLAEKKSLVARAARTLAEEATFDPSELPDEIDCASAEYDHSFIFRIRDREQYYLRKINKALAKIDSGEFGICEECGDKISIKRLQVRPVTTLCIRCKEEQEHEERSHSA